MNMKILPSFFNFTEMYKPKSTDISLILDLSESNKKEILTYAVSAFEKITAAINQCDKKAISTITIVISLSGNIWGLIFGVRVEYPHFCLFNIKGCS